MAIVEEGGKRFIIESGKVVRIEKIAAEEAPKDFKIGDRVQAGHKSGHIMTIVSTVYGDEIAVRFDDDAIDTIYPENLKYVGREKAAHVDAIVELVSDWELYKSLPNITAGQIEEKAAAARALNLRAKALLTDSRTPLESRIALDGMVTSTFCDVEDLKSAKETLETDEENYTESFSRFEVGFKEGGGGYLPKDDASWLADVEEPEDTNWDVHLATECTQAVSALNIEQLNDNDFLILVRSHLEDQAPEEYKEKLAYLLDQARTQRLAEIKPAEKTASATEEDVSGFDATELFI